MKSILVIGLGRFGMHLAKKLMEFGNEVMVVDWNEELVDDIAPFVTKAQIGDCMDIDVLKSLGVRNFDICFVCISENFQSSLEITSQLKELGAPYVISKADRDIHAKFLLKIGADDIIYPERDMAQRAAVRYSASNAFDYMELTPEYAIFEIKAPDNWVNKSIGELMIRSKYNVNVVGIKKDRYMIMPITNPEYSFNAEDHIIVAGAKKDLLKLVNIG